MFPVQLGALYDALRASGVDAAVAQDATAALDRMECELIMIKWLVGLNVVCTLVLVGRLLWR